MNKLSSVIIHRKTKKKKLIKFHSELFCPTHEILFLLTFFLSEKEIEVINFNTLGIPHEKLCTPHEIFWGSYFGQF